MNVYPNPKPINTTYIMDENELNNIVKIYEELAKPENWVKLFPDMTSFKKWIKLGSMSEIQTTLKSFEEAELYEHCAIILEVINERKQKISDIMDKISKHF